MVITVTQPRDRSIEALQCQSTCLHKADLSERNHNHKEALSSRRPNTSPPPRIQLQVLGGLCHRLRLLLARRRMRSSPRVPRTLPRWSLRRQPTIIIDTRPFAMSLWTLR